MGLLPDMKRFFFLLLVLLLSFICKAQHDSTSSYIGTPLIDTSHVKHGTFKYGTYLGYDIFDRSPVLGIRYYTSFMVSVELAYGYHAGPTYNPVSLSYNGPSESHNNIIGVVNLQIKPSIFIVSIIYKNENKMSAASQSSNNFMYATIGLMTNKKINFHGRFGVGHIVGARQDRSGKEYIQPYANIGIGYNFNFKKKTADMHLFNENLYKSTKDSIH